MLAKCAKRMEQACVLRAIDCTERFGEYILRVALGVVSIDFRPQAARITTSARTRKEHAPCGRIVAWRLFACAVPPPGKDARMKGRQRRKDIQRCCRITD